MLANRDLIGGFLLAATGLAFFIASRELDFGSAMRMGPGFFPTVVSATLIPLGLFIAWMGYRRQFPTETPAWRQAGFVLAGVVVFGLVVPRLGFVPAVMASVFTAAFANGNQTIRGAVLLGAVAAAAFSVLFLFILDLPVPAFELDF